MIDRVGSRSIRSRRGAICHARWLFHPPLLEAFSIFGLLELPDEFAGVPRQNCDLDFTARMPFASFLHDLGGHRSMVFDDHLIRKSVIEPLPDHVGWGVRRSPGGHPAEGEMLRVL